MASDLQEVWQKNRSIGIFLLGGLAVFLIGQTLIGYLYRDGLRSHSKQISREIRELRKNLPNASNLRDLKAVNADLTDQHEVLRRLAAFTPGERFVLQSNAGSPENQYFETATEVREELLRQAMRNNIFLPEDLGLPRVSPTGREDVARYLRGLDLVQRVVREAMASGVQRIEDLNIQAPKKARRGGRKKKDSPGLELEEVRVQIKLQGEGSSVIRFVEATQSGEEPLILEQARITGTKKQQQVGAEMTFLAVRFLGEENEEREGE